MNQNQYLEKFRIERVLRKFGVDMMLSKSFPERYAAINALSKVVGPDQAKKVANDQGWYNDLYFVNLPAQEPDPAPVSTLAAFELSKLIHRLEEIEKRLETALPAHTDALSMFSDTYYVQLFDGVACLPLAQLRDDIKDRVYQLMEEISAAKNMWFWMRNEAAQNSTEQTFIRAHRYALKLHVIISHLKLALFEVSL